MSFFSSTQESKNYTCIAASELGSIEFVAQVRVKALPQPPTELSVSDVTPNSVKLTWTVAGENRLSRNIDLIMKKGTNVYMTLIR